MNKTAIKNFAIWARNKLIADISYKAGLLGITEKGIKSPLPQSTQTVQFFDIGTKEPSSITGTEIQQRKKLVEEIERKARQSDYGTAYKNVIEEVAYTWFNRLIAIRFMEVNDYLPTRIRVLSSESNGKAEPDLVTHALEANLDYSAYEKDRIIQLKLDNKLDELFRMLFIKQCNALNENLPELFEKTSDYTELLLNVSFTDKEGVVYHLVNDVSEDDFNVTKEGQVEIIGWMYQYYNTEPKQSVFDGLKKNIKITKEKIPAATQLFTPNWIVRYMVENSLGRLWFESHPNDALKANWRYYLNEAEQTPEVAEKLRVMRLQSPVKSPEDIRLIDPCMGSGHILVYAFDVLMQIYESEGYNPRDAAKLILEKNIFGLDIDRRAHQLAYFSLMMKARQFNRRIFTESVKPQVYHPAGYTEGEEYGSLVKIDTLPPKPVERKGQLSFEDISYDLQLNAWDFKRLLAQKYDVVVTNPPYMGSSGMCGNMSDFVRKHYPDSKSDLFAVFIEKCGELLKPTGYQAMITQHAWMFLSSYEKLRGKLIHRDTINMAHLGARAFEEIGGEVVQTTAFVLTKRNTTNFEATYVRLVDHNSQQAKEVAFLSGSDRHAAKKENFQKIPGSPIAYWASLKIINAFDKYEKLADISSPRQGLATANNNRFLRLWFEVNYNKVKFDASSREEAKLSDKKWFPYNKGGDFRKWYGNNDFIVNWENDGYEIRHFVDDRGKLRSRPQNMDTFFCESITWSKISSGSIAFRYKPRGHIYDVAGTSIFANHNLLLYLQGFCNSRVAMEIAQILSPTINYEVGHIASFPINVSERNFNDICISVKKAIEISKEDWDSVETSWDFIQHPLHKTYTSIKEAYDNWDIECSKRFDQLKEIERELNKKFIQIYDLDDELTSEVDNNDITIELANVNKDIKSYISYAVGCMFGRYGLDMEGLIFAGGDWDKNKYKSFMPDVDNIIPITDDEYFQYDILSRFIDFVRVMYGPESLESNLTFIAKALGIKGDSSRDIIRSYFMKDFFKDHCKTYQKRPIYWLFESGKQNGFKALIYMHRYDENTIGNLRIDYLHRMQRIYENEIARMQETIENSKDAREVTAATKRKEKLIKQLQETKEYDEKIAHLALARISIDLDDGVKVNYEKVQTDRDGKKLDVLAKI